MITVGTSEALVRIAPLSAENPNMVFTSLGHLIDVEMLKDCNASMDGDKAVGIDGISKEKRITRKTLIRIWKACRKAEKRRTSLNLHFYISGNFPNSTVYQCPSSLNRRAELITYG